MIRKRESGYTSVLMKEGGAYVAKHGDYIRLAAELLAGKAFLEFETLYGHRAVLKGACIEGIVECNPLAVEAQRQDNKEEEREDAL